MSILQKQLHVVILAAGKGVRMRSEKPKVLHQLCGRSMLERVIRSVVGLRPQKVTVVVGSGRQLVEEEIARLSALPSLSAVPIESVFQSEQRGTGHATEVAISTMSLESEQVMIVPGDVPLLKTKTLEPFISSYSNSGADLFVLTAMHPDPEGFGRLVRTPSNRVARIVEHRDCSPEELEIKEINTGIYMARREFLEPALASVQPHNSQGEFYLTDVVSYGVENGHEVRAVLASNYVELSGVNDRAQLSELEKYRRAEINEDLMKAGVYMEDPAVTYIDDGAEVGHDCFIGAGTRIRGKSAIGSGTVIEGDSLIVRSQIGKRCHLKLGCKVEDAVVGDNCHLGPYAHLRPESVLHDDVKIGNFVETKKAEMQQGAKANHLSYIGDASVGKDANIGAGTITCNYDGYRKHQTVIGAGASIGSNTNLVAPIVVGDGVVTGAGSTLSKDIPEDALAVERADAVIVKGWAKKRRAREEKKKS